MGLKRSSKRTQEILIFGAGSHARVVVALIQALPGFKIRGILDTNVPNSTENILGTRVIGKIEDANSWYRKKVRYAALAIGDNAQRANLHKKLLSIGYELPVLQHPSAIVHTSAQILGGTQICMGAIVGVNAQIGQGCIVNTGSILDHETRLGNWVHVSPGSAIAGRVTVGEGSFIGIGSRIIDKIQIGDWVTLGAGSVVVKNLPSRVTAFGVPARPKGTS
jgi:sugar O-acyltransferase (sialic acid O-acetyltransferase NeuD family)